MNRNRGRREPFRPQRAGDMMQFGGVAESTMATQHLPRDAQEAYRRLPRNHPIRRAVEEAANNSPRTTAVRRTARGYVDDPVGTSFRHGQANRESAQRARDQAIEHYGGMLYHDAWGLQGGGTPNVRHRLHSSLGAQDPQQGQQQPQMDFSTAQRKAFNRISEAVDQARRSERFNESELKDMEREMIAQLQGIQPMPRMSDQGPTPQERFNDSRFTDEDGNTWVQDSRGNWTNQTLQQQEAQREDLRSYWDAKNRHEATLLTVANRLSGGEMEQDQIMGLIDALRKNMPGPRPELFGLPADYQVPGSSQTPQQMDSPELANAVLEGQGGNVQPVQLPPELQQRWASATKAQREAVIKGFAEARGITEEQAREAFAGVEEPEKEPTQRGRRTVRRNRS